MSSEIRLLLTDIGYSANQFSKRLHYFVLKIKSIRNMLRDSAC
jgi:hypothetical protein